MKAFTLNIQKLEGGKVLELTQDMHKKAWTRIKRAVQKCMAAEGPASPEATELHVAHRQFTRDFKGRAGTRAALTETMPSVTIPAAMEAAVDRGAGNTAAEWLSINTYRGTELADINSAVPAPGMAKAQGRHRGTGVT